MDAASQGRLPYTSQRDWDWHVAFKVALLPWVSPPELSLDTQDRDLTSACTCPITTQNSQRAVTQHIWALAWVFMCNKYLMNICIVNKSWHEK